MDFLFFFKNTFHCGIENFVMCFLPSGVCMGFLRTCFHFYTLIIPLSYLLNYIDKIYTHVHTLLYIHIHTHTHIYWWTPYDVMAKLLDCSLKVSEFEFQSHHYIHFWTSTLWKDIEAPYGFGYGLNSITVDLLQGWL